ncbi:MAG TPA: molybdopterin cofactor-binding domain-containing protein, partial [Methylomirabilota bacterium]
MATRLDRRQFLTITTAAGVGLTVTIALPPALRRAAAAAKWDPSPAMTITNDGIVTVHITKAEMGQGVGTALAQIVAEELEADWKDVRIDYPINDPKFGLMITGGSWSVNWTFDSLSRAGAAARLALVDAAATSWKVPPEECVTERGMVRHLSTGRALSYGAIVGSLPISKTFSEDELKKPGEYRIVGTWIQRLDIPEKTNGRAKFGIDTFLPGMVYAKVAYPPTREGSKVVSVDDAAAKRVKGYIRTVQVGDLVAVVADSYENAVKARDALKVNWNPGPYAKVTSESIFQDYAKKAKEDT